MLKAFLEDESGVTVVPYGLSAFLISLMIIGGADSVRAALDMIYGEVLEKIIEVIPRAAF